MAKRSQVYMCEKCGNVVVVVHGGEGELVCCGEPMKLLEEQTADKSTEKHVPVIEKISGGYKVTVGSTLHPMEEKHYIEWIELIADGTSMRKYLKPDMKPAAEFKTEASEVSAREYCNVHGLWKGEI